MTAHQSDAAVPPWLAYRPTSAAAPLPVGSTADLTPVDSCPDCGEELEFFPDDWNVIDEESGIYCCPNCGWELWV